MGWTLDSPIFGVVGTLRMRKHGALRACVVTLALGLSAATSEFAQAQQPPQPVPRAETTDPMEATFWSIVKDTRNPAELEAYLSRFPNGTHAAEARARLAQLQVPSSSATPTMPNTPPGQRPQPPPVTAQPPPPPVQPQEPVGSGQQVAPRPQQPLMAGSVLRSPQAIAEVQTLLYNQGFSIPVQRGQLDDTTRESIRRFQANTRRPITGDVTEADLQALRQLPLPTVWGAISYSWNGSSGAVWQRPDRAAAEADARKLCEDSGGQRCRVFALHTAICGAVVQSPGPDPSLENGTFIAVTASRTSAQSAADTGIAECRTRSQSPNACTLRNSFCANGAHQR
jgi:hypothetical protein